MNRQELEQRLWRLRSDQARASYLNQYIPLLEKRLALMKEDALQAIGSGRPFDSIGQKSGTGDPTAHLALLSADNALTAEMRACRDHLRRLRREQAALAAEMMLTECLLNSLTEEERFLLTQRYGERVSWPRLAERFSAQFGIYYSGQTLRRRTQNALDSLCRNKAA